MSLRHLLLASLCLAVLGAPSAADEPEQARLTIGADVYNVPIGKAFAVRIGGERVTLRIDPLAERSFEAAGVSFSYPNGLDPSEPAGGDGVKVWTLQGRSAAVMLQQYAPGLDLKSLRDVLVENIVEREKAGANKPQTVKLTGAERAYEGVQLRYGTPAKGAAPATETVQNVFTFANPAGVFALVVQDTHPQGEKESEEYSETLKLLGESLKTGQEPPPAKAPAAGGQGR